MFREGDSAQRHVALSLHCLCLEIPYWVGIPRNHVDFRAKVTGTLQRDQKAMRPAYAAEAVTAKGPGATQVQTAEDTQPDPANEANAESEVNLQRKEVQMPRRSAFCRPMRR
jgi:hypothetical protein